MRGVVVEESLLDSRWVNDWTVLDAKVSGHERAEDRWHLYQVDLTASQIEGLQQQLRTGWYAHFWHERTVLAVFSGCCFEFDADDKATWLEVLAHGRSVGIPDDELDFPVLEEAVSPPQISP